MFGNIVAAISASTPRREIMKVMSFHPLFDYL